MNHSDIAALMKGLAPVIRDYAAETAHPLAARLTALERQIAGLPEVKDGRDGKDADPDAIASLVMERTAPVIDETVRDDLSKALDPVISRIESLEKRAPERGEKGEAGADGKDGSAGEKGLDGKDGIGLAGAIIDRDGGLVVTLTDGTTRDLGPVVGKNGDDGAKGLDGKDGADGFGFDDMEVVHDGARGFSFKFTRGDRVKSFDFTLPVVLDCGVFKEGQAYEAGDGATWGGSYWIAQKATDEKPGSGDGWRLAVKKGRDGKDGVMKAAADPKPLKVG